MYAKFHQNIAFSSREFHFFRIWSSTDDKCHFAISRARYFNTCINVYAKVYQIIPNGLRVMDNFHCFRIWSSAKPRRMINVLSQSFGPDLVNINVCAKIVQNIPNSLRVMDIFHFLTGDKIFPNCPMTKSNV